MSFNSEKQLKIYIEFCILKSMGNYLKNEANIQTEHKAKQIAEQIQQNESSQWTKQQSDIQNE